MKSQILQFILYDIDREPISLLATSNYSTLHSSCCQKYLKKNVAAFSSSHKFHCHIRKVKNQAPLQQNEVSQIFLNLNVWEVLTIQQAFLLSRLRDVDYDIMMYDSMYRNLFSYQNIFRLICFLQFVTMTMLVLLYFAQTKE